MKNYKVIKVSKTGEELLEVVKANSLYEARKLMVQKYMDIVLSLQTQLKVVAK